MQLVSVIVPTYNRKDLLTKTIDSILNQTYKNFVWVVIDDGSEDESYYILKQLQKDNPEKLKLYKSKYRKEGLINRLSYADRDSDILVN